MKKQIFTGLSFLIFFILSSSVKAQSFEWEWQNLFPTPYHLNDAIILPNGNYMAFGDQGTVLRSLDGGTTWSVDQIDSSGGNRHIYEASFVDNNIGYIGGTDLLLKKTIDGGNTWVDLTISGPSSTSDWWYIEFYDADTGYVCGSSMNFYKTTDGGSTWNQISLGTTSGTMYNVHIIDGTGGAVLYAGTSSSSAGRVIKSTDYGVTFGSATGYTSTSLVRGLSFIDANTGFATNSAYQVFKTTDGGSSFTELEDFGVGTLYDIKMLNSTTFIAIGTLGNTFITTDAGTSWVTSNTSFPGANLYSLGIEGNLNADGSNVIFVAGESGAMAKSTDLGATWIRLSKTATTEDIRRIKMVSELIGFASGGGTTQSVVIKTTDGGANWMQLPFNGGYRLYSHSWVNSNVGYVGRRGPTGIFKTTDGGLTFDSLNPGIGTATNIWYAMSFANEDTGYAAGSSGNYVKTTDGGATWVALTGHHGTSTIYDMKALNAQTVISIGSSGKVYVTTDGGATFTSIGQTALSTLYSVDCNDLTTIFVAGTSGDIFKTTDGGGTWTELFTPGTNTLYSVKIVDANIIWASGSSGSVWYSVDGGTSWTASDFPGTSTMYDMSMNSGYLWVAGLGGQLLRGYTDPFIPVELSLFTASVTSNKVILNWQTATEVNNSGFEVERSADNFSWNKIGFVPGFGTTTEIRSYSYADESAVSGKYFYRLKQIDYDGSYEYSNIVEVDLNLPWEFSLDQNYPNPFNPATTINYSIASPSQVTLKIFNTLGEEIKTLVNEVKQSGRYTLDFNASGLASGVYIYQISAIGGAGEFVSSKKLILMK